MKIYNDSPIRQINEDKLGRKVFIRQLGNTILNWRHKESLCVAIHGPWGSGKTSVIQMCLSYIRGTTDEAKKPIIMEFRPWLFPSNPDSITRLFIKELRTYLENNSLSEYAAKAASELDMYGKILGYASKFPVIGTQLGPVNDVMSIFKVVLDRISEPEKVDLDKVRKSIVENLLLLDTPIIIVVDDIDRLTPEDARQIFTLIKSVADFPNTIYLLGFDHVVVGRYFETSEATSSNYLEKIIQLEFDIPEPSTNVLMSYLLEGLENVLKSLPQNRAEQERWSYLRYSVFPFLFRNLRNVKRYINAVSFRFSMLGEEVNVIDLMLLQAIRHISLPLYDAIRYNPNFFISDNMQLDFFHYNNQKDDAHWLREKLDTVDSMNRNLLQKMLIMTFPKLENVLTDSKIYHTSFNSWTDNNRVCISTYFELYFQTFYSEGEISLEEARKGQNLLYDLEEFLKFLDEYVGTSKFPKVLQKIDSLIRDSIDYAQFRILFLSITYTFEKNCRVPATPDESREYDQLISRMLQLLQKIPSDMRAKLINDLCCELTTSLSFPVGFVQGLSREFRAGHQSQISTLVTLDELNEIIENTVYVIGTTANLSSQCHLRWILHYWSDWTDGEDARRWVQKAVQDDLILIDLLRSFSYYSISSNSPEPILGVAFKELERYCDLNLIFERCQDANFYSNLSFESQLIVNYINHHMGA